MNPNGITRTTLHYYGSGWKRALWTVAHFPRHGSYLEPCFGSGAVLFHKQPAPLETVNDLDNRIVNFFRVVRDRPQDLIEAINLTPYAEAEVQEWSQEVLENSLEDARRFFMLCLTSLHGGPRPDNGSFRFRKSNNGGACAPNALDRDDLLLVARRLKNAQILCRDAIDLIWRFRDTPDCLIYFDPPYLPETRTKHNRYNREPTAAWHRLAARVLRHTAGYVVVSGYRSSLYERVYEAYGWHRVEREQATTGNVLRTECLWLSPRTWAALQREQAERKRQPELFLDVGVAI